MRGLVAEFFSTIFFKILADFEQIARPALYTLYYKVNCMLLMLIVVVSPLLMLALPYRKPDTYSASFARVLYVLVAGIILPLGIFLLSSIMVPDWKGGCSHGWIDCFNRGKVALLPIVLWASAALLVEETGPNNPPQPWVVRGLFLGAVVSGICLIFGCSDGIGLERVSLCLLCPFYVCVWHGLRMWQLQRAAKCEAKYFVAALAKTLPFWIASVIWSKRVYASLPDKSPDCFIVTAASRGHPSVVGPLTEVRRAGRIRSANKQLLIFWQFEALWSSRAPRTHAAFRSIYNRLGPIIARQITSSWQADAVYAALKPMEWMAACGCRIGSN